MTRDQQIAAAGHTAGDIQEVRVGLENDAHNGKGLDLDLYHVLRLCEQAAVTLQAYLIRLQELEIGEEVYELSADGEDGAYSMGERPIRE